MEKFFRLSENRTTFRTEILAGLTTFLTMAYIIFVQPAALSGSMFGFKTGMDFGALTTATCLSSALACLVMGLYARYPIALAPGMGENFFFVFSVMPAAAAAGFANSWQVALGVVFISGVLFFVVYLLGIREQIFNGISPSMKNAIAAGIGIFIALIGLQDAGLIIKSPSSGVVLNAHFASPDLIIFFFGLFLSAILFARRVKGAILWGIVGATILAIVMKLALPIIPAISGSKLVANSMLMTRFSLAHGIISAPQSLGPTFLKMDLVHALSIAMWPFIIVFLFMDVFDTIGTLVGVGEQAGLIKDNKLPRLRQAMLADQTGTVIGSLLGTSTVTSYIESAAGVEAGGRTGLTSIIVAILFILTLFFSPLVAMIGSYGVITAPALVMVGAMMMRNAARIEWGEFSESIPAFLVLVGIPFSYSIGDGLALGFISYSIVNLLSGKSKRVSALMYVLSAVLLLYFFLVRSRLG
ncbi:MAG: Xanthine/uracil/vitamin C permease [Desulfotomaculum sp. 46_80]|nr:MAG: Xanthine/uracil/vitamin C permease [Desulfotomaculum sp. 46_80]